MFARFTQNDLQIEAKDVVSCVPMPMPSYGQLTLTPLPKFNPYCNPHSNPDLKPRSPGFKLCYIPHFHPPPPQLLPQAANTPLLVTMDSAFLSR
jgi:hypothetical protein